MCQACSHHDPDRTEDHSDGKASRFYKQHVHNLSKPSKTFQLYARLEPVYGQIDELSLPFQQRDRLSQQSRASVVVSVIGIVTTDLDASAPQRQDSFVHFACANVQPAGYLLRMQRMLGYDPEHILFILCTSSLLRFVHISHTLSRAHS